MEGEGSHLNPLFWVEGCREAKSSVFLCKELPFSANTWKAASRSSYVRLCGCSSPSSHKKHVTRPVCCFWESDSFLFFLERIIYWLEGSGCRGDMWKQCYCQASLFATCIWWTSFQRVLCVVLELDWLGRQQNGITLRLCLMLKINNCTGLIWGSEIQKCHFDC